MGCLYLIVWDGICLIPESHRKSTEKTPNSYASLWYGFFSVLEKDLLLVGIWEIHAVFMLFQLLLLPIWIIHVRNVCWKNSISLLICCESDVLILSSCKTDSEDISTRLLYLYLEYLRFLETSDILILVHYIVWHSLYVLETGLFKFVSLDEIALRSTALLFWLPNLNRSLQAFCLALLTLTTGNDLFISLVIHMSDVSSRFSSVFTNDFGQFNAYILLRLQNLTKLHRD